MAAILTQMSGDADGASPFGGQCRFNGIRLDVDRIRVAGVPGLPHGGDMVDIDAKQRAHLA
jgi:hypothetical protein